MENVKQRRWRVRPTCTVEVARTSRLRLVNSVKPIASSFPQTGRMWDSLANGMMPMASPLLCPPNKYG